MKLNNRSKICVKGLNQERFLNEIIKKFKIYNLNRDKYNVITFEVSLKDKKHIIENLKERNIEIVSIFDFGFKKNIFNLLTCYGLLIGLVLSIIFYIFQYSFIWSIDVKGCDNISKQEIIDFSYNNLPSRYKGNIDISSLETKLKKEFKQISSISISIVGQTLIINLNEAFLPNELKDEKEAIISEYDCLIKEIKLIQGTLNIKVGDVIKKGDTLVWPYIIDSQGVKKDVVPKAEIKAEVWYNSETKYYEKYIERRKTGNKFIKNDVYFLNLPIYKQNKENSFKDFDRKVYKIALTNNFLLPMYLEKTIYYEVENIIHNESFEKEKEKIIKQAREKTLIFLQENAIITNENYTIKEEYGCYRINYFITTDCVITKV